ncbi:DUF397 domain-containing protein [Actinomadura kijaniata]|uniref:DUF397 domain-containing protein n=1 Tax=Actinomadura kijaniata TaxID=46161 RepID=UPI003F1DB1DB
MHTLEEPGHHRRTLAAALPAKAAAAWRKSSHSAESGECVEIACLTPHAIGVRDSKNPAAAALIIAPDQWRHLLHAISSRPGS